MLDEKQKVLDEADKRFIEKNRKHLRDLVDANPHVRWGFPKNDAYGPGLGRYTTQRQLGLFGEDNSDADEYASYLEEHDAYQDQSDRIEDDDEDEIGFLASAYYFWDGEDD